MQPYSGDICKVHGIRVGQMQNETARTGVTVVLGPREGAMAGVSVRGAAPGTRAVTYTTLPAPATPETLV